MTKKLIFIIGICIVLLFSCADYFNAKISTLPGIFGVSTPELSLTALPSGSVAINISTETSYAGKYEIHRAEQKDGNGNYEFSLLKTVPVGKFGAPMVYTDDTVKPTSVGKKYVYQTRFSFQANDGDFSEIKEIVTILNPPTLSVIMTDFGEATLSITSPCVGTYKIERAEKNGSDPYVFTVLEENFEGKEGTTTYVDNTLEPTSEKIYAYKVQVFFRDNPSDFSEIITIDTKLGAPTLSVAKTNFAETTLSITSPYGDTYRIERAEKNGSDPYIFTVLEEKYERKEETTTYVDTTLEPTSIGKTYAYRVQLFFRDNPSDFSETREIVLSDSQVQNFTISKQTITTFTFSWNPVPFAATYKISYAREDDFSKAIPLPITINDTDINKISATATGLETPIVYYFWIQPQYAGGKTGQLSASIRGIKINNTVYFNPDARADELGAENFPVKTMAKAIELLGGTNSLSSASTIWVMGTIDVEDTTIWNYSHLTLKRYKLFKGALINVTGGTLNLENITIDGNNKNNVMAEEALITVNGSTAKLVLNTDAKLQNNNNLASNGGGVMVSSGSTIKISGGTITNNLASNGGGMYVAYGGFVELRSGGTITISGNKKIDSTINNIAYTNSKSNSPIKVTGSITVANGTTIGLSPTSKADENMGNVVVLPSLPTFGSTSKANENLLVQADGGTIVRTNFSLDGGGHLRIVSNNLVMGYEIGDRGPGGGLVFNIVGAKVYECSNNLGSRIWSDAKTLAANHRGGDYTDWYLPNKTELNSIYQNLRVPNLISDNGWFWSSSEFNNLSAWSQHFGNGSQSKDNWRDWVSNNVRAIRAFNY